MVEHCWKIRDRKQGTDIGKNSFVNSAIKNWKQLHAIALEVYLCKPKVFLKEIIANIKRMRRKVYK
jgi:hypothetical protein